MAEMERMTEGGMAGRGRRARWMCSASIHGLPVAAGAILTAAAAVGEGARGRAWEKIERVGGGSGLGRLVSLVDVAYPVSSQPTVNETKTSELSQNWA